VTVSPVRRALRRVKHATWLARRRLDAGAASLPLLRAKERVYDAEFYAHTDEVHGPMYSRLAEAVWERLHPASAVDVGCGTGFILTRLAAHGVEVRGIEGSRHAIEASAIRDRIVRANLEREVPNLGRFDLAICIEVAEHLPGRVAPSLVDGLAGMSDRVLFTAAQPGQGGTHHVNEQPPEFWLDLFARHGLRETPLTQELRADIAEIPEPEWMAQNLLLLAR
jgi:SAM-dependent methyltransferase